MTNLTATVSPTSVVVVSDTGTDATIPLADSTNAGVMPPEAVVQLAGLGSASEADVADFATANHTHALLMTTDERTKLTALPAAADLSTSLAGKMPNTLPAMQTVFNAGTAPEKAAFQSSVSGDPMVSTMTVTVKPIRLGAWSFAGGSIDLPGAGTWFVGVELWSGRLRVLPRNIHRGIVYVAQCVAAAGVATITKITPVMPATRIPKTLSAIRTGRAIKAMILGSSLTEYYGTDGNDWPSMLFSQVGVFSARPYLISYSITPIYAGLGSSPINYHTALCGVAMQHDGAGTAGVGMPSALRADGPFTGRSQALQGVDLVIIGPVANTLVDWWDSTLALVRQAQRAGAEVILLTDEGVNPSTDYTTMSQCAWYIDGPRIADLADLTGAELADTAGYMAEAYVRSGGVGIYRDLVHQSIGAPSGPSSVLPANGMECWARAIRSLFTTSSSAQPITSTVTYDWSDGTTQGWVSANTGTVANSGSALSITVPSSNNAAQLPLGIFSVGDVVKVKGKLQKTGTVSSVQMSISKVGIGSYSNATTVADFSGAVFTEAAMTITSATSDGRLVFWINGAGSVTVDDFTVTITRQGRGVEIVSDTVPNRPVGSGPSAVGVMASSLNSVGDVAVVLPAQEYLYRSANANAGTLGASPNGAGSFARRVSASVSATGDLLTLATGKQFALSHQLAVSYGLVYYRAAADAATTLSIASGGVTIKTVTLAAIGVSREFYAALLTPAEAAAAGNPQTIIVTVTAGSLKLAAGAIMTPDIDYLTADDLTYIGTWGRDVSAAGLQGRWTDTTGDAVSVRGQGRAWWVLSGTSGAQPVDVIDGPVSSLAVAVAGGNATKIVGGNRGERHALRNTAAGTGAAGNRALAVSGVMLVRDR